MIADVLVAIRSRLKQNAKRHPYRKTRGVKLDQMAEA